MVAKKHKGNIEENECHLWWAWNKNKLFSWKPKEIRRAWEKDDRKQLKINLKFQKIKIKIRGRTTK